MFKKNTDLSENPTYHHNVILCITTGFHRLLDLRALLRKDQQHIRHH